MSSGDRTQPHWALKIALWLLIVATAALAIYQTRPPRPLDHSAPPTEFSAARAKLHVDQIAREPHPIGTDANRRVRDYLMEQLTALGAEVRVETTVGIVNTGRSIRAGSAENIVATVPGTANRRAVMLASHYDSVPLSPGASDAGAGVASILEVIRALKNGPPLKNDVIIVYTDGEEEGLLGAAGFVRDHPDLAQRVGVVMNLEARGSSGPALMFETSDGNGWLAGEFARVAPHAMGSSLAYAVYKEMPNDTDMTVFKRAGLMGLNFAFSATFENYHTPRDAPGNLSLASVQHLGVNALALTRHFGNSDTAPTRQSDRIYFNSVGSRIIHYPSWVAWVVLGAAVGLLIALFAIGLRAERITIARAGGGLGGFILLLLASAAGAHLMWWLIQISTRSRLLFGDTPSNMLLVSGCIATGVAFCAIVQSWLVRKLGFANFVAGQMLGFALLTAAVTIISPAASYVFQSPLVFALAGILAASRTRTAAASVAFSSLAALPAILIVAPLTYFLFVVLGMNSIAISVIAVLLGLLIAITAPLFVQISRPLKFSVPLAIVTATALVLLGREQSRFSPEHPRRNTMIYSINADEQKAAWISYDDAVDEWTAQLVGRTRAPVKAEKFMVGSPRTVISSETELLPLEPPIATVLSDVREGEERVLKLHLRSPRQAIGLQMRFPESVKILSLVANGRPYQPLKAADLSTPWTFRYTAPPPEGIELELRLTAAGPFTCWLADRSLGLPTSPTVSHPPRPSHVIADYGSDAVIVGRQYTF